MATAPVFPSEIPRNEKENYFRMRLLLERATDVLRDVLRTQLQAAYPGLFDPSKSDKLYDIVSNQQVEHSLLLLKKRKVVNSSQMKLLYPSGTPSTTVTTQDLDITLAAVLLRNITNLNPRAKWDNPPASDTSIEANIGRVKTYRNNHMHESLGITDKAFQAEFNVLKHVLLSLSSKYTSDDYDKLLFVPLDAKVAPCQLLSVQLPGKPADLKGREDLVQQIQQHIAGETRLVLLTGMGGIGKTSVAIEVGHREKNVLYFDMRQATNLESVKLALVQHYHPTRSLKDLYSDFQNIFVQTLSSLTSNTVLIFDNNDEAIRSNLQEFHKLVQTILNSTKQITLLCTSREAFSLVSHKMAVVEVPPLDKAPSIDILWEGKNTSPTDSESLVLGEIAEKCGGNPLALTLLAVQLKKKTAQRVLDRMKNKHVIENLHAANLPASQEMMACLDMSYETLNTEEQKVFRALHIFPVSFSLEEVSEMLEIAEDECESILDSLCNKSLLCSDPSCYDVHPLLRSYAAFRAETDQNEISRIQNAYCNLYMKQTLLLVFKFDIFSSKETYEEAKKLLPHLKVIAYLLLDQLGNKKIHDEEMTLLNFENLYLIACVFQNLYLYPEALTILETLKLLKVQDLPSEKKLSIIYAKIGKVLKGMGKYKEALTYSEKYLEILKESFDEKHPVIATAYVDIGSVLNEVGKYAEALTYYEKSLVIQREILGEKHIDTAETYRNIGNTLCAMGRYAEALRCYEKCLKLKKETLGEKHPNTAETYQNIGAVFYHLGKYAESLTYNEKSLEIVKEILGEKHPDTLRKYHNNGGVLWRMGKYAEALTYYKKCLQVQKEILGEKHPDTASTYQSIGALLSSMGRYSEALTYDEKSLKINKEIFGEKHPVIAGLYGNIGAELSQMGKHAEAISYYEKSLEIEKEMLGDKHSETAGTYKNIGNALCGMGKCAEAISYYEKSLEIEKEMLGDKHSHTAWTYKNIGNALCGMGKCAEAISYYEKSLEIEKEMLGDKHPDTAWTYQNIGAALYGMGKCAEAISYYEKSLEIEKEMLGDKHSHTAGTYKNIGNALCGMGKCAEAISYYEKSLEIEKEMLGDKHPDTAWTYQNIGNALRGMGKCAEAISYYEKSIGIWTETLGEKHPGIAATYHNIGNALCDNSKYAEALPYYEKSLEVFREHFGPMHSKTRCVDSSVRDVKRRVLNMVIMNMCKYIATELIVKGKYGQAGRILSFIGWDFRLLYKF